jgi:hypothetical protein
LDFIMQAHSGPMSLPSILHGHRHFSKAVLAALNSRLLPFRWFALRITGHERAPENTKRNRTSYSGATCARLSS